MRLLKLLLVLLPLPALASHDQFLVKLSELRPTQNTAGFREVQHKFEKLSERKDLDKYVKSHPVEGIKGPDGALYIIDGHHFALAAQHLGLKKVYFKVLRDYSDLSEREFWQKMRKKEWILLGETFPRSLFEMTDDPYRSLASFARRAGAFKKSADRYAEFLWADFFRKRISFIDDELGFEKAVQHALRWAAHPQARDLPGYITCADVLIPSDTAFDTNP